MHEHLPQIGFGGGCHWCTEAVFASLRGVVDVKQGWIASGGDASSFSEAVLLRYAPETIPLKVLVHIHLLTHSSTSMHAFRKKYRSAVYTFGESQASEVQQIIAQLARETGHNYITQALPFRDFRLNQEKYQQYYLKHADKPFCKTYIEPKLSKLRERYSQHLQDA